VEVVVIFDPAFDGHVESVVWIVGTPENRKWFDAQTERDPNSAVFSIEGYLTVDDAVAHMVWNAPRAVQRSLLKTIASTASRPPRGPRPEG
jgi:hypothetical protein